MKLRRKFLLALAPLALLPAYLSALTVSGPSEAPTLLLGDRVLVNRAAYRLTLPYTDRTLLTFSGAKRGDLVLFHVPNRGTLGLKRVIGLPGDVVELKENLVFVNGQALAQAAPPASPSFQWVPAAHQLGNTIALESTGNWITYTAGRAPLRTMAPVRIPAGHYFLLGDHRDNSNDSRVFGPLDERHIHGRVEALLTSSRPRSAWPPR